MKLGISSKLWIVIIIVVIVGSLFNYWTTLVIYEHFYVEQTEEQLEEKGKKIAEWYHGGKIDEDFKEKVKLINDLSNEEIVIADNLEKLGECLPVDRKDEEGPLTSEDLIALYNGDTVTIIGEHTSCEKDIIAVAVPLIDPNNGQFIGAIFIYMPLATITEAVSEIKFMLLIYILIFLLLGIIGGSIITRRITRPMVQMEAVAHKMVDGDFEAKVDIVSDDEIGRLGKTFNHLSDSLKETIELLSKEKNQLSQILDGIRDGVITIDRNGELILCNCSTINLLDKIGLTKEEFLQLDEIKGYINSVFDNKEIVIVEFEYQDSIFILYFAPLLDDSNTLEPWGIVFVIHDVTEERQREKEAREFLAIVSHELRTPLSFMKGFTEALIDGVAQSKETQDRYLNTIYKETERMERLVNDLLDLAQLEKGTYKMELEHISLNDIAQQIVERYRSIYDQKYVKLEYYNLDENKLFIYGDEDRIIQILVNLLENALRYTNPGGKVLVKTYSSNTEVVLEVSDTGEGIEKKYLNMLGKKFFRVDKARSRKNGGIGLGLAIVKQIVERLNGRMEIESTVEVGTTFRIIFPNRG